MKTPSSVIHRSASSDNLAELNSRAKGTPALPPELRKKIWEEIGRARMKLPRGASLPISPELAKTLWDKFNNKEFTVSPELVELITEEIGPQLNSKQVTLSDELAERTWEELGPDFKDTAGDLSELTIDAKLAEKISEEIGPRVMFLSDKHFKPNFLQQGNKITILATGCGGDEGDAQEAVAEGMDRFIGKHPEMHFAYVINTGDNFYTKGVDSPTHPDFYKKFYFPYFDPKYPHLRQLRFLMTLGNHDGNRRKLEYYVEPFRPFYMPVVYAVNKVKTIDTSVPPSGKDAEKNQVMHMHLYRPEDSALPETSRKAYQRKRIDVNELRKFDMPYFHTSRVERDKFQEFFVNSNTLLQDFLDYLAHITGVEDLSPEALRKNQVAFLLREYPKCMQAGLIPLLIQHHPFIPMGDRAYPKNYDSPFYLYPDQIRRLDLILQIPHEPREKYLSKVAQILIATPEQLNSIPGVPLPTVDAGNYCIMLARFFASYNMVFRMLICAHDHMLGYRCTDGIKNVSQNYHPDDPKMRPVKPKTPRPDDLSNYPIRQLTTGGGGGKLQFCDVFSQIEDLGIVMKDNGFAAVTLDPDKPDVIDIHLVTIRHTGRMVQHDHRLPWEDDLYLRFDTNSSRAIREPWKINPNDKIAVEDRNKVITLTSIILKSCHQYNNFLNEKMGSSGEFLDLIPQSFGGLFNRNFKHKRSDVIIMHKMMSYLNQYKRTGYDETLAVIQDLAQRLTNNYSQHSLLTFINTNLKANKYLGNKKLEDLFNEMEDKKQHHSAGVANKK